MAAFGFMVNRKRLQEKKQENPYFNTLNYQENSGFGVFFFLELFFLRWLMEVVTFLAFYLVIRNAS